MTSNSTYIGQKRSVLICLIFIFSILTFFNIGAISTSFIFGIMLIILSLSYFKFYFIPRGLSILLLTFIIISLIGLLLSGSPLELQHFKRVIQVLYWFLLAVYIFNSYDYLDKKQLSKVIFIAILVYLFINLRYKLVLRNEVAFTVIIMGPMGLFFLPKYIYRLCYSMVLLILMFVLGSRTGAIICLGQMILFLILFTPRLNGRSKLLITVFILLIVGTNLSPLRKELGQIVLPVNERIGLFLVNPEWVFKNDISWLQRRAQIQKGFQIFKEHPILGIGIFNFQNYEVDIDVTQIQSNRGKIRNIDFRSSHNVYISLLSETGILGFTLVIVMFLLILYHLFVNIDRLGSSFEAAIFISFMGMLVYFYFISSFFGTSSWLLYGLTLGAARYSHEFRGVKGQTSVSN